MHHHNGPQNATRTRRGHAPAYVNCTRADGEAVVAGLSWSSTSVSVPERNAWVAAGAEAIDPIQQARFRVGMTF